MFQAGIARTDLTPFWGVELTGWGYYIQRRWRRIHDRLNATALVVEDGARVAVVIALDLMVIDAAFTQRAREMITDATGIPPEVILLTCSHSHNAPAAGGLLGVGECDPLYEEWASKQAATAAILAWQAREPATLAIAHADVPDVSFNRTRTGGVIDARLTALRIDRADGSPLAVAVGFGSHPTIYTEMRPWDVTRDVPGEVCDGLEAAFPGATAMYVQGACGDVNFHREYMTPERSDEPASELVAQAAAALKQAPICESTTVAAASEITELPTRRWTREEIEADREEAARRLAERDTSNWRETFGRSMTNRPDDMVKRHGGDEWKAVEAMCRFKLAWTDKMLQGFETRPCVLPTEVQAIRMGDLFVAANSSEFFSPFALEIRARANVPELLFACYANGRIGYLPDAHDIAAKSYAGFQSPKYCDQFPFTPESGPAMCEAMLRVIERCRDGR
jgi:hypothetical protein